MKRNPSTGPKTIKKIKRMINDINVKGTEATRIICNCLPKLPFPPKIFAVMNITICVKKTTIVWIITFAIILIISILLVSINPHRTDVKIVIIIQIIK